VGSRKILPLQFQQKEAETPESLLNKSFRKDSKDKNKKEILKSGSVLME
jgi:hypothetical protein